MTVPWPGVRRYPGLLPPHRLPPLAPMHFDGLADARTRLSAGLDTPAARIAGRALLLGGTALAGLVAYSAASSVVFTWGAELGGRLAVPAAGMWSHAPRWAWDATTWWRYAAALRQGVFLPDVGKPSAALALRRRRRRCVPRPDRLRHRPRDGAELECAEAARRDGLGHASSDTPGRAARAVTAASSSGGTAAAFSPSAGRSRWRSTPRPGQARPRASPSRTPWPSTAPWWRSTCAGRSTTPPPARAPRPGSG